jgi:hypothetical protein
MYPTGGFTTLLSPDACQVAINTAMYEELERERQPAYLSASEDLFFHNDPIDVEVFVWDEDSNVGPFEVVGEQAEIPSSNSFVANQKTARVLKYMKNIPISWEAFKTDQIGKRNQIGINVGDRARLAQDKNSIINVYGDAFDGNVSTTPDGGTFASNTHTTVTGFTVDNLETAALAPDALWTAVNSLAAQLSQDGEAGSYEFSGLLVAFTNYKTAKETLNSDLVANSGENNLNIFETDYGFVSLKASIFLNSAYNPGTNANTAYHLLSRNHMVYRKVLSDLSTDLIDPTKSMTDSWQHRSRFAEVAFPGSWSGYVGCNGSA